MIKINNKELNQLQMQKKVKSAPKPKARPEPAEDPKLAATKELAEAIRSIPTQNNDQLDLNPLIAALTKVQESQVKLIKSMESKPKNENWEFAVSRNKKGEIEKVFARNV